MDWQPPHRTERLALCALALEVGPEHPTLCEGWQAQHLLGHLWVREHSPAAIGIVAGPLAGLHDSAIERAIDRKGFAGVVQQVRSGPPLPLRPLDATINLIEMFVHHEDLRRGAGDHTPRSAADVQATEAALWKALPRAAGMMARSVKGAGLQLEAPRLGTITAARGEPVATLTGSPGELVLFLYGRGAAADAELTGDPDAVEAVGAASFGI